MKKIDVDKSVDSGAATLFNTAKYHFLFLGNASSSLQFNDHSGKTF